MIDWEALRRVVPGTRFFNEAFIEFDVTDTDHLGEFAGRSCYKAFGRERAETATTAGYLNNILTQGHYSVLEHASVSFHVSEGSRSMLLELERHRHISLSVESQRYVDQTKSHPLPVVPADFGAALWAELDRHYADSMDRYEAAVERLLAQGKTLKEARGAARAFLPESTPVDFVVTANLRAWRDVLGKRHHVAAENEIREFAAQVLSHLRVIAPLSVQDISEVPYGSEVTQ
ncbi:FAD-dependent thymidylate synthase [Micromonospora sp. PSH03]|uniref:FAD-dependent thymidylate synthase n=1 Tax=Micromonospora salmantinae TaxID=2911211 RepID=UPI001EE84FA6|nr:FAD-dependent thymidylate synthase [Micromonospora salmantinae]MCG5459609.1 FAD-dependent thymidylate synthase [Micromonospora salmantinae]